MPCSRWVITPSWLCGSWRSFLHSSVYSCHPTISVLYCVYLFFMKYSLGNSNFLDEISSLSHSIVFLYFFALIAVEGFLISPCYSLEFYIQLGISFLFSFAFCFTSQLFIRAPQTTIWPFCIFFSLGWSWSLPPVQYQEPPSIILQALCLSDLIPWQNLVKK